MKMNETDYDCSCEQLKMHCSKLKVKSVCVKRMRKSRNQRAISVGT